MIKQLRIQASLFIAILLMLVSWLPAYANASDKPNSSKPPEKSFLYVVDAQHGTLKHIKSKKYTLTIPLNDIKSVLTFTDRPYRMALRLSPDVYAHIIHRGPDSFDKTPPNAVIHIFNKNQQSNAFTINGYKKNKKYIIYNLTALENKPVKSGHGPVSIFIDDTTAGMGCSSTTSTTAEPSSGATSSSSSQCCTTVNDTVTSSTAMLCCIDPSSAICACDADNPNCVVYGVSS